MACAPASTFLRRESWAARVLLLAAGLVFAAHAAVLGADFSHTARVFLVENLTRDVKRVRLQVVDGDTMRFSAGQFVMLSVPEDFLREWNARYKTSHTQVARPYSFASSPDQLPFFDLIVKLAGPPHGKDVPPGIGSSYVHQLRIGDSVHFSDAMGELSASPDTGRPVIVVAGGTGAAPFFSFFQSWFTDDRPHKSHIYFFFGVGSRCDLFLDDQFERWARSRRDFTYVPALSGAEEGCQWRGETGYLSAVLNKLVEGPSEADAYLAGSPVMMKEVEKVLLTKGITKERIHHDPITVQ